MIGAVRVKMTLDFQVCFKGDKLLSHHRNKYGNDSRVPKNLRKDMGMVCKGPDQPEQEWSLVNYINLTSATLCRQQILIRLHSCTSSDLPVSWS